MKFDVKYKPSHAMLVANFDQGETITGEEGSCLEQMEADKCLSTLSWQFTPIFYSPGKL